MQTAEQQLPPSASPTAGRPQWMALAVLALAQLMIVIDVTIVTVALPSAELDLHISASERGWVDISARDAAGG